MHWCSSWKPQAARGASAPNQSARDRGVREVAAAPASGPRHPRHTFSVAPQLPQ